MAEKIHECQVGTALYTGESPFSPVPCPTCGQVLYLDLLGYFCKEHGRCEDDAVKASIFYKLRLSSLEKSVELRKGFVQILEHVQAIMNEVKNFMEQEEVKAILNYEDLYGVSPYEILIRHFSVEDDQGEGADMTAAEAVDFLRCNYEAELHIEEETSKPK